MNDVAKEKNLEIDDQIPYNEPNFNELIRRIQKTFNSEAKTFELLRDLYHNYQS